MNKTFRNTLLMASIAFAFIPAAQAVPLYAVDTFIGSAILGNSSDQTELNFAQQQAGAALYLDDKKDVSVSQVFSNGVAGQWYLDVTPDTPGYFSLKFGTGGTGVTDDTYFFKNIADLTKLVWSDSQVNNLTATFGNLGVGRLSHYTTYGPDGNVPEPASLLLFGLGIATLWAARRRQS